MSVSECAAKRATLVSISLGILGVLLHRFEPLAFFSFDAVFLPKLGSPTFKLDTNSADILLLTIDSNSKQVLATELDQPIDRTNHAVVLNRLTHDGSRLVVFDLIFDVSRPEQDSYLGKAMARNRKVLLASKSSRNVDTSEAGTQLESHSLLPLPSELSSKALGIGNVTSTDTGGLKRPTVWRRHARSVGQFVSLPVLSARNSGVKVLPEESETGIWLNFYGPDGTLPRLSFASALIQENGFFSNKVVFIGDVTREGRDRHATPFSRWGRGDMSGTEIIATNYLNLVLGDSLRRLTSWQEIVLLLLVGASLGLGASVLRPRGFIPLVVLLCPAVGILAVWWGGQSFVWFNWAAISLVQCPVAAMLNWHYQKTPQLVAAPPGIHIPGHSLYQAIGEGGFGKVYLAKNDLLETFRAVKVVYRTRNGTTRHFDHEMQGVKLYEPISRDHPALVQILHVGHSDQRDYFYYVMELADAQIPQIPFMPAEYQARTLASDLRACLPILDKSPNPMSAAATLKLGMALAEGVAFLHSKNVVHRDLKPGNILFVGGRPKLGDPGLATEADRSQPSQPGTFDYVDPETHGTRLGDIFSLGRLLRTAAGASLDAPLAEKRSVTSTSCDLPISEPAMPVEDPALARQLNAVIEGACAPPQHRFQSAEEFRDALRQLVQTD